MHPDARYPTGFAWVLTLKLKQRTCVSAALVLGSAGRGLGQRPCRLPEDPLQELVLSLADTAARR